MLFFYFVIIISIIFLFSFRDKKMFDDKSNIELYSDWSPTLYSSMGPVDMLIMDKLLLINGYRFQNSLISPQPINLKIDLPGSIGPIWEYPENYRQIIGSFKEKTFVEKFGSGASQATLSQLNFHGNQDKYLFGQPGDIIESSWDNMDPFGKYVGLSVPNHTTEINYPNEPFSWGDIITRFYTENKELDDIII